MKLYQGQLKETIKILTYQFVVSLQKITQLHQQHLLLSNPQLYLKILQSIQLQGKTNPQDDCFKLLENSYEEKIKYEWLQKESPFRKHSLEKNSQSFDDSDYLNHHKQSQEELNQTIKSKNFYRQRAQQTTKYHQGSQQQISMDNCKKQEMGFKEINDIFSDEESNSEEDNISLYQDQSKNQQILKGNIEQTPTKFTFRTKKYRSYTQQQKDQSVKIAHEMGVEFASRTLNIPKKNIARWMIRKENTDKLRGRKPGNPDMEQNLTNWLYFQIRSGTYVTQNQIRSKARYFSGDQNFKASKGWLQKYFRRNREISEGINELFIQKKSSPMKNQPNQIKYNFNLHDIES